MKKDKATIIKEAVANLFATFQRGDFPNQLAHNVIRKHDADIIPSDSWSLGNRALMFSSNTADARGYKQWLEVGRQVRKGSKAIYIFAPMTKKVQEVDEVSGEEEEKIIVVGFTTVPVFRYEDTDGEELPEFNYRPQSYPHFFDVAKKLNLKVEYRPLQANYLGRYVPQLSLIQLCSWDSNVYYHELAHAVHNSFVDLARYDSDKAEIVAEFSACVLSELSNSSGGYEFQGYKYLQRYCGNEEKPEQVLKKIMGVLNEVEKVVEIILDTTEEKIAKATA